MLSQKPYTHSREEEEVEADTVEDEEESRSLGALGARLERILQTTAGAKEERATSAREKTKDQLPPGATTVEKKDT
jgi:hypothetical protein